MRDNELAGAKVFDVNTDTIYDVIYGATSNPIRNLKCPVSPYVWTTTLKAN